MSFFSSDELSMILAYVDPSMSNTKENLFLKIGAKLQPLLNSKDAKVMVQGVTHAATKIPDLNDADHTWYFVHSSDGGIVYMGTDKRRSLQLWIEMEMDNF